MKVGGTPRKSVLFAGFAQGKRLKGCVLFIFRIKNIPIFDGDVFGLEAFVCPVACMRMLIAKFSFMGR